MDKENVVYIYKECYSAMKKKETAICNNGWNLRTIYVS